jgi:phosphatidylglycerophosphate synthase
MILRRGKILAGALLAGKISTAVLFVSLIVMVLFPGLDAKTIQIITLVDSGVLLASFIGYARIYYTHSPMIQELEENKDNEKSSG